MKERSYTVRVHTHPEAWGNENFLATRYLASTLLPDAAHINYRVSSRIFWASNLSVQPEKYPGYIPGTCTMRRHSAYLFSPDVIQHVICEPISRVVCHPSTCEIA